MVQPRSSPRRFSYYRTPIPRLKGRHAARDVIGVRDSLVSFFLRPLQRAPLSLLLRTKFYLLLRRGLGLLRYPNVQPNIGCSSM